jgi:probable HAF family extracellular repeat protein
MRLLRFLVLVGAAAVVAGSAFAPASISAAASEFTIVDLGVGNVVVNDANDAGQAAGRLFPPSGGISAFSWTQADGLIDLGTLGGPWSDALTVTADGRVLGWAMDAANNVHAFSWTGAGGMVDLGFMGSDAVTPTAANESGRFIGYVRKPTGSPRAFTWTQAGGMVDLGLSANADSNANAVNEAGMVVGSSDTGIPGEHHAFVWTPSGGLVDIATLGGSLSVAKDVNNAGQVTGYGWGHEGPARPFLWTQATGMVDIIGPGFFGDPVAISETGLITGGTTIGAFAWTQAGGVAGLGFIGGTDVRPAAVNASDRIVGGAFTGDGFHAFTWTAEHGIRDLGTLGSSFSQAHVVNNAGQIFGLSYTAGGEPHLVLWEPVVAATPAEMIDELIALIDGYAIPAKDKEKLQHSLRAAQRFIALGKLFRADDELETFIRDVGRGPGRFLTDEQKATLIGDAREIQDALGA